MEAHAGGVYAAQELFYVVNACVLMCVVCFSGPACPRRRIDFLAVMDLLTLFV